MSWRTAQAAISARLDRPSLARMFDTCTAAVFGRDEQPLGELAVGQAVGEQGGDLALPCRQLAVEPGRRALQPPGQRLGPVPPHARPAPQVVVDRLADGDQRPGPVAGSEQGLGERRAQRPDHRLGEAGVGLGEHAPTAPPAAGRGSPAASASSPSAWARKAAFDGCSTEPAVEHPRPHLVGGRRRAPAGPRRARSRVQRRRRRRRAPATPPARRAAGARPPARRAPAAREMSRRR